MAKIKSQFKKCRLCKRTFADDESGEDDDTICIDCECEIDAEAL